jgi:hypothetical protein
MQDVTHDVASNPNNTLARYVAFASVAIIWTCTTTVWVAVTAILAYVVNYGLHRWSSRVKGLNRELNVDRIRTRSCNEN